MWFEELMGFKEMNPEQVRQNIDVVGNRLKSKANDHLYQYGDLTTPTLNELRTAISLHGNFDNKIRLSEVVGNVQNLHCLEENNGALFQAASQFNLLEMVGPNVTPEEGVGLYEYDLTQGPACAIACGAGTIYRNYFTHLNGKTGQSHDNQIDCLRDIGIAFENEKLGLWKMSNGYALVTDTGLKCINNTIDNCTTEEYEQIKGLLRIGVQKETEVTIQNSANIVTQAYCSALPVAYTSINLSLWEPFARMVLEATYEATLYAALENSKKTKNNKVFLTLVGGGVFGNDIKWILDALKKAVIKFENTPLDVIIVSYGSSNKHVSRLIDNYNSSNNNTKT